MLVRQGRDIGFAIAFGEERKTDARALRSFGIYLAIAHKQHIARAKAQLGHSRQQRRRVGLAYGQAVAANHHRKHLLQLEMRQNRLRGHQRLVGANGQAQPRLLQAVQTGGHIGVKPRQPMGGFVMMLETRNHGGFGRVIGAVAQMLQRRGQQMRHPAANKAADCGKIERLKACLDQHRIGRGMDIWRAVNQRAIQIENNRPHQARRTNTEPTEYPAPNEQITPISPTPRSALCFAKAMIEPADEVLA